MTINCGLNIMNCRVKHEYHPRTVIYRRLCLARHFSAGFVMLPSVRGFNPMHSPVVSTPGQNKNRHGFIEPVPVFLFCLP